MNEKLNKIDKLIVMILILLMWATIFGSFYSIYLHNVEVPNLETELQLRQDVVDDQKIEIQNLRKQLDEEKRMRYNYENQVNTLQKEITSMKQELNKLRATKKMLPSRSSSLRVSEGWQVTHYNLKGITASGRQVSHTTIAVDPDLIPLGTWVELTFPDGRVIKRRAEDVGSKVKGKIIDLWVDADTQTTYEMGRIHNVQVKILGRDEL